MMCQNIYLIIKLLIKENKMTDKLLKPIIESTTDTKVKLLKESINGEKNWYIQGTYAVANEKNSNNRIYPYDELFSSTELYKKNRLEHPKGNRAIGELGHPSDNKTMTDINHDNVAHKIIELNWEQNILFGKSRINESLPKASTVIGLMTDGYPYAVSLRGFGDTTEVNNAIIISDLFILCWDLVDEPGFGEYAFMDAVYENKRYIISGGEKVEEALQKIDKSLKNKPKFFIKEQEEQFFKSLKETYLKILG